MKDKKYTIEEVLPLRREYLDAKLKLLGYDFSNINEPLNSSTGYRVLGKVGKSLEDFIDPLRESFFDTPESQEKIGSLKQEIQDDYRFMDNQDELFRRLRDFYPDFGYHMKEKISPKEWEQYSTVVGKTAKLLQKLVADKVDLSEDFSLRKQDEISELIDSSEFADACMIEDTFMKKEIDIFQENINALEYDDPVVKNTNVGIVLFGLAREAQSVADKKQRHMDKYAAYKAFCAGIKDRLIIKVGGDNERDEHE